METEIIIPQALQQAILQYADEDKCLELLMIARWPDGVVKCAYCGGIKVGFVKSRRLFQCKECRKQFSIKIGTYMEDSPLKLSVWLPVMWIITNARNGVSSHEIARSLGVSQKTAWLMMHRVLLSFGCTGDDTMQGAVAPGETLIGCLGKTRGVMELPRKPDRPKIWTPPPGHDNMMAGLKRALSVSKEEIDRRELEWRKSQQAKKGKKPNAEDSTG